MYPESSGGKKRKEASKFKGKIVLTSSTMKVHCLPPARGGLCVDRGLWRPTSVLKSELKKQAQLNWYKCCHVTSNNECNLQYMLTM